MSINDGGVTRPVRWWRDDDARYAQGRPPASRWGKSVLEELEHMDSDWRVRELNRVRFSPPSSPMIPLVPLEFESLPPQPDPLEIRARHCYRMPLSAFTGPTTVWRDHDPGDEQPADRWPYALMNVRTGGVVCYYPGQRARVEPCGLADHDPGDESDARTGPIELRTMSYTDGIDDGDDYETIDKT